MEKQTPTITSEELRELARSIVQKRIITFTNLRGEFGRRIKIRANPYYNLLEISPIIPSTDIFVRWKAIKGVFDRCTSISVCLKNDQKSIKAIGELHGAVVTIKIYWNYHSE